MKKYIIILVGILISFNFYSCSDSQEDRINFDPASGQTLLTFSSTTIDLPVLVGEQNTIEIPINSTTISSSERTFPVSLDLESSTADASIYSVGQVVIPANSHIGSLAVTGVDNDLLTDLPVSLFIELNDGEGYLGEGTIRVNIFETCDTENYTVPDGFMIGDYLIEEITPFVDGPTFSNNTIVSVYIPDGADNLTRAFMTFNYPDYCQTESQFIFNLLCGKVLVPNDVNQSNCSCGGNLWFNNAEVPESFDINDDTEFFLTFTNDPYADCLPAAQTTYKFTKQ